MKTVRVEKTMTKPILCNNCDGQFEEEDVILVQDGRACTKYEGTHRHDPVWLKACPNCRTDDFLEDVLNDETEVA